MLLKKQADILFLHSTPIELLSCAFIEVNNDYRLIQWVHLSVIDNTRDLLDLSNN